MAEHKPIRVLEVIGRLERGGVEVWLMNMLRNIDHQVFQIDFAVHVDYSCPFDEEARQLGAQIFRLRQPKEAPFSYRRRLAALLRGTGPYDVVHSHVHFFSGFVLQTAARCGVPIRIAHSHNDSGRLDRQAGILRRSYLGLARRRIHRHATHGMACSSLAAEALFGKDWAEDPRWRVLHYGIDFKRLACSIDCESLRGRLGIPIGRQIVGQVSRLEAQKNHGFALHVFNELLKAGENVHYLIVGGGSLEHEIRSHIKSLGLETRVSLAGDQSDVAPYLALMDCMLFPSTHEGLGIVALEAQAAGVPTLASDRVPTDIRVVPGLVAFLPLEAALAEWVTTIKSMLHQRRVNPNDAIAQMQNSDFAIAGCLKKLCATYRGQTWELDAPQSTADVGGRNLNAICH